MDVADWLRALGLERYEATFSENDVDTKLLPNLTAVCWCTTRLAYDAASAKQRRQ
jgi:SAM domain (Sterile alpha motif)